MYQIHKHYPTPFDVDAHAIYTRYLTLVKTIIRNWQQEVVTHLIGYRDWKDLQSCQLKFARTKTGDVIPTMTLRPVIGPDTQEEVNIYFTFFELYKTLIIRMIMSVNQVDIWAQRNIKNTAVRNAIVGHRQNLAYDFGCLRLLLLMADADQLSLERMMVFEDYGTHQVGAIQSLIRELEFEDFFGKGMEEGRRFFDDPSHDLLEAFYRYVRKTGVTVIAGRSGRLKAVFPTQP